MEILTHLKPGYLVRLKQEINSIPWTRQFNRRIAHLGPDYPFSGIVVPGLDWSSYPLIKRVMDRVNEVYGFSFNACLLNWYTGRAGIGAHKDIEPCLEPSGIVSVSLGDPCEFLFRESGRVVAQFTLNEGDVFYFSDEENRRYTHEIPKTVLPNGRVSLTFRQFKGI